MVLGLFKKSNEQLELQREFLRNCREQLEDLEQRINDQEMANLRATFPEVWVDDQAIRELPEKVRLAGKFATELGEKLSTAKTALDSMWSALETLQGIIDHCEHGVQDMLAGLVMRQSLAASRKADDAQD